MRLPARPTIYEINTAVWLGGRTLDAVPAAEWDALAALPVDAVWLMGVWRRSPAGLAIALDDPGLMAGFRSTLPDLEPDDVIGSPYCVREYVVDERFGGPDGAGRGARATRGARARADSRLRAQPRRARSPMAGVEPGVLRGRQRRGPCARPGLVPADRRRSDRRARPRPVLSRMAGRGAAQRVLARPARRRDRPARRTRCAVRRAALRHGDAHDQRGVRPHLGTRAARRGVLAGRDRPRQSPLPGARAHRRGLLGHGMDTPAAGLRLLLRQAPLRPPGPRRRRRDPRPPLRRRRLPRAAAALHREPRRAARGRDVRRPAGARRGGRGLHAAGCAALSRRPARRASRPHPRLSRPRTHGARRRRRYEPSTSDCCTPSTNPTYATGNGA